MIPCSLINLPHDPNATPPPKKKKSFMQKQYMAVIKDKKSPFTHRVQNPC